MKRLHIFFFLVGAVLLAAAACSSSNTDSENSVSATASAPIGTPAVTPEPTPALPDLQAELLDARNKTTDSPIGKFDFQNFTYPLPRGWQNPDGSTDITLTDGRLAAIPGTASDDMSDAEKAEEKSKRRIGMKYVTTKFLDVTGDGNDEALVVLKIETTGSAIPQVVYVFSWTDGKPGLIWPFRTGDRADGGLKDIIAADGEMLVELYGEDRFLLGQNETGKITGDEEQLCCPTHFTRTRYKWNGKSFLMQGKRLTYLVADPTAPPVENLGDVVNNPTKNKK